MSYRLVLSTDAFQALKAYVDYIAVDEQSPLTANRWFQKAWDKLQTLRFFPHRCPPAPENDLFEFTVRMLIVDNCLFLYSVDEGKHTVRVFGFRHSRQLPGS